MIWTVENPRTLLDKFGKKPVSAVIEHVRDGSTVRVLLLPSFHYITVMISGIRVSSGTTRVITHSVQNLIDMFLFLYFTVPWFQT